jgi:hypothetical protein
MKNLEKQFTGRGEVRGFKFNQLLEINEAFLYQVENQGAIHYEVIKKVVNPRFNRVSYPGSKSWGLNGWTAYSLEQAISRLQSMLHKAEQMPEIVLQSGDLA